MPFELVVFALAATGLLKATGPLVAAIFAGLAIVNAIGLTILRQWEH